MEIRRFFVGGWESLIVPEIFEQIAMDLNLSEIAELVEGKVLRGEGAKRFRRFASLAEADGESLSFFGNQKYAEALKNTEAGAVLVSDGEAVAPEGTALIQVENPVLAFDIVIRKYAVPPPAFVPGAAPGAFVDPSVVWNAEKVSVLPNASVLAGASIGDGTRIGAGSVIGHGVRIGRDCEIGPNVSIREGCILGDRVILHAGVVIGADGFGFEFVDGRHQKIEQLGIVRIADDVEIGASTTIDRARFGETYIGEGTKIDNQVQIGHNCVIGKHCIIVAQVGISGSSRIGDYVTLAAQCGVAGHLVIADRVTCGGRSGVISSITEPGGVYFGYPAKPIKESRRESMRAKQVAGLIKRVEVLEKALSEAGDQVE